MSDALSLQEVSKRFAGHQAVDRLSLAVPRGSIYGVLGPNGAGKSTTIRIAMNIVARDEGEVRLLGSDPAVQKDVLRRVGYLPEERGLYKKMRVIDVIEFFGRLKGLTKRDARNRGIEWLERMGLADWPRNRVEQLSKGMQQKVQFITTVLHEPELLILDEPASGLDPVNQEVFRAAIKEARDRGTTIVLSTHNMKEAEELCESVCIIADGKKVLDGRVREIRKAEISNRWVIEFDEPPNGIPESIAALSGDGVIHPKEHGWELELPADKTSADLLTELARLEPQPIRIARIEPTLHEIFVARVGGTATRPARRD